MQREAARRYMIRDGALALFLDFRRIPRPGRECWCVNIALVLPCLAERILAFSSGLRADFQCGGKIDSVDDSGVFGFFSLVGSIVLSGTGLVDFYGDYTRGRVCLL